MDSYLILGMADGDGERKFNLGATAGKKCDCKATCGFTPLSNG